jgi:hypothetical protein
MTTNAIAGVVLRRPTEELDNFLFISFLPESNR